MTSRRHTMSNQRWNNFLYVNVEIHNVEQRRINVVYFNVDINNVWKRQNNVIIFNVDFYNAGNVETTLWIWPFEEKVSSQKQNNIFELQRIRWTQNLLHFVTHFKRNMSKNICRTVKIHQIHHSPLKTSNNIMTYKNYT